MTDKILIDRSVLEQALEALTNCYSTHSHRCIRCDSEVDEGGNVAAALSAALEQPQVKQSSAVGVIGWKNHLSNSGTVVHWTALMPPLGTKLYTRPQPPAMDQPQVEQKPVAWFWIGRKGWTEYGPEKHDLYECKPLYTHPHPPTDQQPYLWYDPVRDQFWNREDAQYMDMGGTIPLYTRPQPKRQPLTKDEINTIWRNSTHMTIVEVVRAIEAAHGIGGDK